MSSLSGSFAVLLLILHVLLTEAQTPVLTFACSDIPDVCTNMCWGAYCTRNIQFGTNLRYDTPRDPVKKERRKRAGCLPGPNRCSALAGHPRGFNCDEYPFASTGNADDGSAVSRCVPSAQNSLRGNSQGGILSRFYRQAYPLGLGGVGRPFSVAFNTAGVPPGGADFCNNEPCINPANEPIYQAGGPAPNPPPPFARSRRSALAPTAFFYKTTRGLELSSPHEIAIGSRTVEIKPRNLALLQERTNGTEDDDYSLEKRGIVDDDDMWESVQDTIVARLDGPSSPAKRSTINKPPERRSALGSPSIASQPLKTRQNSHCDILTCLKDIGTDVKDATNCFKPENPEADIQCALGIPIKTIEAVESCAKCRIINGGCPNGGKTALNGALTTPFDRSCGVKGARPALDGPDQCSQASGHAETEAGNKLLGGRVWHCSNTASDDINRCDFDCGSCPACS